MNIVEMLLQQQQHKILSEKNKTKHKKPNQPKHNEMHFVAVAVVGFGQGEYILDITATLPWSWETIYAPSYTQKIIIKRIESQAKIHVNAKPQNINIRNVKILQYILPYLYIYPLSCSVFFSCYSFISYPFRKVLVNHIPKGGRLGHWLGLLMRGHNFYGMVPNI